MYACMHVCMYGCMDVCMYVRVHVTCRFALIVGTSSNPTHMILYPCQSMSRERYFVLPAFRGIPLSLLATSPCVAAFLPCLCPSVFPSSLPDRFSVLCVRALPALLLPAKKLE